MMEDIIVEVIIAVEMVAVINALRFFGRTDLDDVIGLISILAWLFWHFMKICFIPFLLIMLGAVFDLPKMYYRISVGIYFVLWIIYVIFF